jgi:phosphoglycolate phosphatase
VPTPRRAVVFDLDGTLLDSAEDIHAALTAAFAAAGGRPGPSLADLRPLIGRPLEEVIAAFAPAGEVPELAAAYRAAFLADGTPRTRLHAGADVLLARLREAGWAVAVATTKSTEGAHRALGALGLVGSFDHVQGTDGFACKPAPDVVLRALAGVDVRADRGSWMVGDTVHDVAAGVAAGLSTAAVTHGAHGRAELLGSAADLVIDDLAALTEHLLG